MSSRVRSSPSRTIESLPTLTASTDTLTESRQLSSRKEDRQTGPPPRVPGYTLGAVIGQGSYAQVWKAVQNTTHRRVAVKIFQRQTGVNWLLLQREVEVLIQLDKHPHVVSLLDANLTGTPPFYVMEFMDAGSLQRYVNARRLATEEEAIHWMRQILSALAYVHARGLIHCDLKPANVLVDSTGHVRVADFGQARVAKGSARSLGTLGYMAPEQAVPSGDAATLQPDPRWDVYALGATIYAILTGRAPHERTLRREHRAQEALAARLASYRAIAERDPLDIRADRRLDRDFAAIINRCLDPDPARRYPDVGAVAADLAAHDVNRPVSPLAHLRLYRAEKFVRRHRELLATAVVAALGLAGLAGYFHWQRTGDLSALYLAQAEKLTEAGDLPSAAVYYAALNRTSPSWMSRGNALACLAPPAARTVFTVPDAASELATDPRGSRVVAALRNGTARIWRLPGGDQANRRIHHLDDVVAVAVSPGGDRVATGSLDRTVRLWDADSGEPLGPPLPLAAPVVRRALAFNPAGTRLAAAGADGGVLLWNSRTGRPSGAVLRHPAPVTALAFSPDGARLATGCRDGSVRIWRAAAGTLLAGPWHHTRGISALAFSPDERWLAVGHDGGAVRLRDPSTGQTIGPDLPTRAAPTAIAFAVGGRGLLTGTARGVVRLWDLASREPVGASFRHEGEVAVLQVRNGGLTVLTAGSADRTLRRRDLKGLAETVTPEELVLRVEVSTHRRLRANGALEFIPVREWRQLSARLAALGAPRPGRSEQPAANPEREAGHVSRVAGP